ncbi:MAG: Nif3-like dinuclear metal center hexameric protein [Firmicutes bacterium]|nr:Nif3-like dinuclear metal center hexameric protein [Bacillota bacterium]
MAIKCKEVVEFMEEIAPTYLAEEWDNVGLIIGNFEKAVKHILVCLDITSPVVEYAETGDVDMIISHHPLIFKPIKGIHMNDWKGNLISRLIKKDICVYCTHTNLDYAEEGVNWHLARSIGLTEIKDLEITKSEKLYKVVVFTPANSVDTVREAMSKEGAGWIGKYSDCFFMAKGIGTFKPLDNANPYIGIQGILEKVEEYRLETIVPGRKLKKVIGAMLKAHPYEEVAYDIYPLEAKGKGYSLGKVGILSPPQSLTEFIGNIKKSLKTDCIRLIGNIDEKINRVAVFAGSFDETILKIMTGNIDILITGDVRYHTAIEMAEMGMCVIDAGHFSTENIIIPQIVDQLKNRFPEISITGNTMEMAPFKYY